MEHSIVAGKSSTLERIAMTPIFPIDKDFCTRQAIVLSMNPNSEHDPDKPKFVIRIPAPNFHSADVDFVRNDATLTSADVQSILNEQMQFIATSGRGIIEDQEIIVEIHSSGVPKLSLVDLPGLIAFQNNVQDGPEDDLALRIDALSRQYLDDPNTGAVVCVVVAGTDNLKASKALR